MAFMTFYVVKGVVDSIGSWGWGASWTVGWEDVGMEEGIKSLG